MIKICHVQLFPVMGGVQRAMLELFQQLDRSHYEIHVICKEPGPLTRELAAQRIAVHYVPQFDRPLRAWQDYRAYRQLRSIFKQHDFQIVHTHSSKPGYLGRLAARRVGVPIVVHHVQGFSFHEFSSKSRHWLYKQLERHAAHYCDCMLFANGEERELVASEGWIPADNCVTIYNGVDLRAFHPAHRAGQRAIQRAQWSSSDDEFVILFQGRLDPDKQPLLLADIAGRLDVLRSRTKWRLLVAGSGENQAQLVQAIKSQALTHRVRLLGWQNDPASAVHAADAVLLPSVCEGLPRSLIEAQAAGLPCVASDIRGNREVVTEGTGELCPAKNARGYAEALVRLMDNPQLVTAMGQRARQHAEQCFDTVTNNRQIVGIYESLLDS